MLHTFPNLRICLMVGIGGGAPSESNDIRLGDVVVSTPDYGKGTTGIFQYDFGKAMHDGSFQHTGHLNQPPQILLSAVSKIDSKHKRHGHQIASIVDNVLAVNKKLATEYKRPDPTSDKLFQTVDATIREKRDNPKIHYGLIASANQLMKDARIRDKLASENGVLCFEMEAAGLMNHFPCLVVRGICDYSDHDKNDVWQGYAAMTAAAYAKDLLSVISPTKIVAEKALKDVISSG